MKKVSKPFKIKNRPGYYVRWYEAGRERLKQVNTLDEAEMFRSRQYMLLNNDVYSSVSIGWSDAVEEYLQTYDVRNLETSSKDKAKRVLKKFKEFGYVTQTKQISQRIIDNWILDLLKKHSPFTVNDYLSRLRAFIAWAKDRGYHIPPCRIALVKQRAKPFICPNNEQIKKLLKRCPSLAWKVTILIYLTTGLRREDLRKVKRNEIDLSRKGIIFAAKKTRKIDVNPLPDLIIPILKKHLKENKSDHPFHIVNWRKAFGDFKGDFTFQIFRKINSTLMQTIGNIGSAQELLQHSDSRTTKEFYSDNELIMRFKVNKLPVGEWL